MPLFDAAAGFTSNSATAVGTYILGAVSGEYIPVINVNVVGNTVTLVLSGRWKYNNSRFS